MFTALGLLVGFMVVEVVVGLIAQSLALITDAGAIGMSLVAMRLASRPASGRFTFGLKRVEILSAQANGLTLLLALGLVHHRSDHATHRAAGRR